MTARASLKRHLPRPLYLQLRSLRHRAKRSLSQAGQDVWVFGEAFNGMRDGYFLEIGSDDGISLNNTFLLEKRYRWRGLCIEANPMAYQDLVKVRRATCLNACVDSTEREVDFVQRDQLSGILADDTDNRRTEGNAATADVIQLKTRRLAEILGAENAPREIDYLSIDVEGAEERVLLEFPFDEYRFRCMTVERPAPRLREVLAGNGYLSVKEIPGLDVFYIHRSFEAEYARNVFAHWRRWRESH